MFVRRGASAAAEYRAHKEDGPQTQQKEQREHDVHIHREAEDQ
jgi:hypothetical protein